MAPRILLAEDHEPLAKALSAFLAGEGFEVTAARTGPAAEEALCAKDFDLLVLDLMLPVLSGVELLRKLRSSPRWASLPVIIISGVYKGDKYIEAARRLGIEHYLEKPFARQAFLDAVHAALPAPATAPALVTLSDVIADVYDARRNGILLLPDGLKVSFINGEPFSFDSAGRQDFASHLAARGKISLTSVRDYAQLGVERLFFTETGLLTYDELVEESRLFLAKTLMEALASGAAGTFVAGPPAAESPLAPLSLPRLLYECRKEQGSRFDHEVFITRFGSRYPARTLAFFRRANILTMHRDDIALLQLIDGQTPCSDIVDGSSDAQQAISFLHFLYALGMIDFNSAPCAEAVPDFPQQNLFNRPLEDVKTDSDLLMDFDDLVEEMADSVELAVGEEGMAAPLSSGEIDFEQTVQRDYTFIQGKNYYEIFGLSAANFSFNMLKEAYFEKTRQYSPEKFMELSGATLDVAQEVLSHYANAYTTLSSVVAKERYDEMLNAGVTTGLDGKQDDKLQARIQFQSGSVFLEMGEYENAEKALQEAYTLEPDEPLHAALYAWAVYRNPANKNSKGAADKARMLLARSLQNGKIPEAYAFRGWMLLEEGREGLAEGEFLKALKLNARQTHARSGMKVIEERRESEKKGLFRRMFS